MGKIQVCIETMQLSNATTSSLKIVKFNNGSAFKSSLFKDNNKNKKDNFDENKILHFLKNASYITKFKVT